MLGKFASLRPVAWIIGNWQLAAGIASVFVAANSASYFIGRDHGGDSVIADQFEAEREAAKLDELSKGKAAGERETDTNDISDGKDKADDAIRDTNSKDVIPSAASNALNCERMRRAGRDISEFPACR